MNMSSKHKQTKQYLLPILTKKEKLGLWTLYFFWFISVIFFYQWWLAGEDYLSVRFHLNNFVASWLILVPGYFFYLMIRIARQNPNTPLDKKMKIAMITTRVPSSEPWSLTKATLLAMKNQKLSKGMKYDIWLADEAPDEQSLKWCEQNGVRVCSRNGIPEYNQDKWPRRKKCKEGNLAYFYDKYGYELYDVVVQLDADHIPEEDYLAEMVRPFADPEVGYVSAPSICDLNREQSWSARGRLYREASFHGAMQVGLNDGFAPVCIGSHYAVRTSALKQIGGIGPELAEDHSTTLMMAGNGWKGVHAIDAFAHGLGPETFADCMVQEFQWSRSLVVILLSMSKNYVPNLPFKQKFQFLFSQVWYPLMSGSMLLGYLIPLIALATNTPYLNKSFLGYLIHFTPQSVIIIFLTYILKRLKVLRPIDVPLFSWEGVMFELARWPWIIFGCVMAVFDVVSKKNFNIKVTPKDKSDYRPLAMRTLMPYNILIILGLMIGLTHTNALNVKGYYYFTFLNAFVYILFLVVVITKHHNEQLKLHRKV